MSKDDNDINTGSVRLDGEGDHVSPKDDGDECVSLENALNDTDGDLNNASDDDINTISSIEYNASKPPDSSIEYNTSKPPDSSVEYNTPEQPVGNADMARSDNINMSVGAHVDKVDKTGSIDMSKTIKDQKLTQSEKSGFDPTDIQDARRNDNSEGGIARNRTTGNQFDSYNKSEGGQVRPQPQAVDYGKMYEVSSFTVSFEKVVGQGNINVEICDHFIDIETAQASMNGEKYLMPVPQQGYRVVDIVAGAPTISYQNQILYEYINDKWRRK